MISFASLFVGLVYGIVTVQLLAAGPVDRVDLLLDGLKVAELRAPFSAPLDLGCEPAPHELVAVAFDSRGAELARARQWVNRPRPQAEATLVLEPGSGERGRTARLTWRSLAGEVPRAIAVTFDDRPLPAPDPSRIEVPPHDPAQVHVLRASLDFGGDVRATAEAYVGGSARDEAVTELTAVAVEVETGRELPPPEGLAGWLEKDGVPLEAAAVEEGPAELVFVAEGSVLERLRKTFRFRTVPLASGLPPDLGYRFLWPVGAMTAQSAMVSNVYPVTRRLSRADGAVSWVADRRLVWPAWSRKGQRIADAVAVAALVAAEGERRRAVVLLLGPEAEDGSLLTPAEATAFLGSLNVPLQVWSIGARPSPEAARWPAGKTVTSARQFEAAVASLLEGVVRQRVVWVEGGHLPQSILPSATAPLRLAR